MPDLPEFPDDDDAERYVGLAVGEARDLAAETGWGRVREVTGENPVITMEWLADRINFHVRDDRVIKCWLH